MSAIATEKQINFILSLDEQKNTDDVHPILVGCIEDIKMGYDDVITKKYASKMIEILLDAPRKIVKKSTNSITVNDGRYAVKIGDKLRFFHVNSPTQGRWAGYTFLNEQAGPELYSIRNAEQRQNLLKTILEDSGALARYGQELGVCGMCGRELTDAESRSRGIGPVCRSK